MKKIITSVIIGVFLTFTLQAKNIAGKIILGNDTLDVVFQIPVKLFSGQPNFEKLQYKVRYLDSNKKKITLRPHEAKEIQFMHGAEQVRMLSRFNTLGLGNIFSSNTHIFLRLEIDGPLKLFSYYYTQQSPGMYNASTGVVTGGYAYSVERYIMQKGSGELKRPKNLSFKKDMAEYFSDCPTLVDKIQDKDFKKYDMEAIVSFYNKNCR